MNYFLLTFALSFSYPDQEATRKLLLFGNGQSEFTEQLKLLKQDTSGMTERDLVIIIIENETDYRKYNVPFKQFTLLLIGKDGGEKLRSVKPVKTELIFGLIDSMPMRQREMRRKGK